MNLTWSDNPPTELVEADYKWESPLPPHHTCYVTVWESDGRLFVDIPAGLLREQEVSGEVTEVGGRWAGPIPEPKEPNE